MYERAVLRKPVGKTFGATVDLWSIGNDFVFLFRASFFLRLYSNKISITVFYFKVLRCTMLQQEIYHFDHLVEGEIKRLCITLQQKKCLE